MKNFLVNIYAYKHHGKFKVLSEDDPESLENAILDKLGKNDIEWEPNLLRYNAGFHITYEEVEDGRRQNVTVLEETKTRV